VLYVQQLFLHELTKQQLASCLQTFVGEIEQVPPMYSALKHNGKKLYELAREGITVERKARKITIYDIKCLSFADGLLILDVQCSKGTYIRTLALGCILAFINISPKPKNCCS
jgi:tRNA pseudouridine55 synthase